MTKWALDHLTFNISLLIYLTNCISRQVQILSMTTLTRSRLKQNLRATLLWSSDSFPSQNGLTITNIRLRAFRKYKVQCHASSKTTTTCPFSRHHLCTSNIYSSLYSSKLSRWSPPYRLTHQTFIKIPKIRKSASLARFKLTLKRISPSKKLLYQSKRSPRPTTSY